MGLKNWIKNLVSKKQSNIAAFISPNSGKAVWSNRDYAVFAKETYTKNWASHKAIDMIGKAVNSVSWGVFNETDTGRDINPNHPLNQLISISKNKVNFKETFGIVNKKAVSYLCISGNCFIRKVSPDTGPNKGIPQSLEVLRPDRMKIIVDTLGRVTGYEYRVSSGNSYLMGEEQDYSTDGFSERTYTFPVDPDTGASDILHISLFHPLDDYWGLSPSEAIAYNLDISNEMTNWNKKLLDNECRPGLILKINGRLSTEQFDRIKAELDRKSGSENAGKNLILDGAEEVDATPFGFSPADIDFLNGSREEARKISNVYGVPSMLLGIPGDNTYSNYQEARKAFWEETVVFYLTLLRDCYNWWLFGDKTTEFIDYDLDNIPAMEPDRQVKWERANLCQFLTINEKREMVGYEAIEGGDVLLVPMGSIPLEEATIPLDIPSDKPDEEPDEEPITEEEMEDEEENAMALLIGKVRPEDIPDLIGENGL